MTHRGRENGSFEVFGNWILSMGSEVLIRRSILVLWRGEVKEPLVNTRRCFPVNIAFTCKKLK